jgi:hypothetical protein
MWMMAAAVGLTALSTFAGAKGAQDKGVADQNAMNSQGTAALRQAAETEEQAKEVGVQAQQAEAQRMDQLQSMLASNESRRAAAGLTADSATTEAIREQNLAVVGRGMANIAYNGASQQARLRRQAKYGRDAAETYVQAGRDARSAADAAMWGTIFRGASSMAMYAAMPSMGGAAAGGGAPGVASSAGGAGARMV